MRIHGYVQSVTVNNDSREPTLDDVRSEYPRWYCWSGISGLVYGKLRGSSPVIMVRGEDPLDLRDQIRRKVSELSW
jgi:hypothetical protein